MGRYKVPEEELWERGRGSSLGFLAAVLSWGVGGRRQLGTCAAPSTTRLGLGSWGHQVLQVCVRGGGVASGAPGRGTEQSGAEPTGGGVWSPYKWRSVARARTESERAAAAPASRIPVRPPAPLVPARPPLPQPVGRRLSPRPLTRSPGPAPPRPPAACAAMGVEGCTKCIKYLLFVFNFVFWVSPGRRGGGAAAPRSPQAARPARPRRGGSAGPPSCGATCARWERGWGSWAGGPRQWGSSGAVATPDGGAGGCEPGLGACGASGPGSPRPGRGVWGPQVCSRLVMVIGGVDAGSGPHTGAAQPPGCCSWDHPASRGLRGGLEGGSQGVPPP